MTDADGNMEGKEHLRDLGHEGVSHEAAPRQEIDPRGELLGCLRALAWDAIQNQHDLEGTAPVDPYHQDTEVPYWFKLDEGKFKIYVEGPVPDEKLSPQQGEVAQINPQNRRQSYWIAFDFQPGLSFVDLVDKAEEATIHVRTLGEEKVKFTVKADELGRLEHDDDESGHSTQSVLIALAKPPTEEEQKEAAKEWLAKFMKCKPSLIEPNPQGNGDTHTGLEGNNVA